MHFHYSSEVFKGIGQGEARRAPRPLLGPTDASCLLFPESGCFPETLISADPPVDLSKSHRASVLEVD